MEGQRSELIELVEKNGWKATELDNYEFHKWSMETWLLESAWSPLDAVAYVSFLIDPMSDFQQPCAWAIRVSSEKPAYGKESGCLEVSLNNGKTKRVMS